MVPEGNLTSDGERTMRYTSDLLLDCTLEMYTLLLTNVIPINLSK